LVLGLAFKANVQDIRGSPSFGIMEELARLQAIVDYHDPFVPEIPMTREHGSWVGHASVEWSADSLSRYDVVIISTAHNVFRLQDLIDWCPCIVDTRNVLAPLTTVSGQVFKA
jgi:UDP-N-acetyl-D-glucosamine dehydrogenase